jgi:TonB-dependent SusC/RagA subfamily outer membrane receptor
MTSSLSHAALSFCALIGLASGCASGKARPEPVAKPTATQADVERGGGESIEKVLQAKAPGLLVSRTSNGGISIRIRGSSSFSANSEPLFVIDEMPISAGPGGALLGVSPHDIDTIKVLKNPEDTAMYGMRGANGVIVITTKKPGKKSS